MAAARDQFRARSLHGFARVPLAMSQGPDRNRDVERSYRRSHLEKGADYDSRFKTIRHRALMWELERKALDDLIATHLPGDVHQLDFACGTGRILQHLAGRVQTAVGIDVSGNMLEVARKNAPQAELIQQDLTQADALGDRQFNLITAFRFFPNAEPALRESAMRSMVRHLAPGGVLIFNNHRKNNSAAHLLFRMLRPGRREWTRPEELTALVSSVGLEIVAIRHLGFLPFWDGFMPVPIALARPVETLCARSGLLSGWAQNWIYACRKVEGLLP